MELARFVAFSYFSPSRRCGHTFFGEPVAGSDRHCTRRGGFYTDNERYRIRLRVSDQLEWHAAEHELC
jgi:hypothetical protein